MNLEQLNRVYFVGVGGIGMSALARFFRHIGKAVAGYDRTPTELTRRLEAEGIAVHYTDEPEQIAEAYRDPARRGETLVVFTPAIPAAHRELNWFRDQGYTVMKRAEVLGLITRSFDGVAVAGSHGKSTISSLTAHLFSRSEEGCSAFLGAISKNTDSNLMLNRNSRWAIMEADEFDRSFLHLEPVMALVTSMDPDHLDIYGGSGNLRQSFEEFLSRCRPGARLVIRHGLDLKAAGDNPYIYHTYGFSPEADFHPTDIRQEGAGYQFSLVGPKHSLKDLSLQVPGWINVENAVAATALALLAGIPGDIIREGLETFTGVRRRLDIRYRDAKKLYMDDYAHHPKEIHALIESVRKAFPDQRITGVFQPHLFTRTRDFAAEFAHELSRLDELLLMDIYPAREEPIEGVSAALILDQVRDIPRQMADREAVLDRVKAGDWEVFLTIGAGDIDQLVQPIEHILHEMDR